MHSPLRTLREKHGLTQAQLASKIGLDRTAYVRLELGQRRLDVPVLRTIADTLGLNDQALGTLVRSFDLELPHPKGADLPRERRGP